MRNTPKNVVILILAIAMLVQACAPQTPTNIQPVEIPVPPDTVYQSVEIRTVSTMVPEVEISPVPKPTPEPNAVEMYGLIINALGQYLSQNKARITSEESYLQVMEEFTGYSLQIGGTKYPIRDTLASFSKEEWDQINEAGKSLANDSNWEGEGVGEVLAAGLMIRGCKTSCREIFEALWYAMVHFASGTYWFTIIDGYMTTHPRPTLNCGRTFDWETLLDILEQNCTRFGYSVSYVGSEIRVTSAAHKKNGGMEYSYAYIDREGAIVIITIVAVVVVVGIFVISTGGAGGSIVPVLLVAA